MYFVDGTPGLTDCECEALNKDSPHFILDLGAMNSSARKKKTILFLAANSKNTTQLRLEQEVREIDEGLRRSQKRTKFQLEKESAITPRGLQRAMLDYKPQIVHFSAHGVGDAGLVLEDDTGQAKLVQREALGKLFRFFAEKYNSVPLSQIPILAKAVGDGSVGETILLGWQAPQTCPVESIVRSVAHRCDRHCELY